MLLLLPQEQLKIVLAVSSFRMCGVLSVLWWLPSQKALFLLSPQVHSAWVPASNERTVGWLLARGME